MATALSDLLGMGIAIELRNMFSAPASAVVASSRALTDSIVNDQSKLMNGWKTIAGGASMMFVGTGMLSFLGAIGKASIKSANDMEIFRLQIRLLSKDNNIGDDLFARLKMFSTTTPFTIPNVMAGARNLLSFGFTANRVVEQLKLAGDWASMMSMPLEDAALIIGKVRTGAIQYAMRSLQRAGIGYADIRDAGGPIKITKNGMSAAGADPEKFLAAVNRVIASKFGGGMSIIMHTVTGMITNIKDQLILMGNTIGSFLVPQVKTVLEAVLGVFKPDIVLPFASAVGQGLAFVLRATVTILRPIGEITLWFMRFAGTHPLIMKLGFGLIALTGVILNVAGASLILLGIWNIISFVAAAESTAVLLASFTALLPVILAVAAAVAVLYVTFRNNFLGAADVARYFYDRVVGIASGVFQLFSTMSSGVGTMSQATADSLNKMGIMGIVVQLFMLGYRVMAFFGGLGEVLNGVSQSIAFLGSMVTWAISPIWGLVVGMLRLVGVTSDMNPVGLTSTNMFRNLGIAVGVITIAVYAYRGAMIAARIAQVAWTVATVVWGAVTNTTSIMVGVVTAAIWLYETATRAITAAQWLLNIAMDANPIGIVIAGVAVAITLFFILRSHMTQITNWFNSLGPVSQLLAAVFMAPIMPVLAVIKYSDQLLTILSKMAQIVIHPFDTIMSMGRAFNKWDYTPAPTPAVDLTPEWTKKQAAQSEVLSQRDTHSQQTLNSHMLTMAERLQSIDNFNRQQAVSGKPTQVTVMLDSKVLAKSVNKVNGRETASGR